jgi:hypothetical protein
LLERDRAGSGQLVERAHRPEPEVLGRGGRVKPASRVARVFRDPGDEPWCEPLGEAAPTAVRGADGKVELTFQQKVSATQLPDNTRLSVSGFGMRAAHVVPSDEPPQVEVHRGDASEQAATDP